MSIFFMLSARYCQLSCTRGQVLLSCDISLAPVCFSLSTMVEPVSSIKTLLLTIVNCNSLFVIIICHRVIAE